jgi:hypothetical protein
MWGCRPTGLGFLYDNIRVLIDPRSDNASVWQLAPATRDLMKLRGGPDPRDEPFQENVPY